MYVFTGWKPSIHTEYYFCIGEFHISRDRGILTKGIASLNVIKKCIVISRKLVLRFDMIHERKIEINLQNVSARFHDIAQNL